ncbi:MAG: DUF4147 domain-containing protein, partial [Acidobacteria bacterium]|nr:DUF4147 domain-containing protein [Acidobacteriota bacterium]
MRKLVQALFLKTLPHLQVGPRMKQMVRLCDGVLEIQGDRIALHPGRAVRVVAMGKAAIEMTHTLAEIMLDVRLRGVVAAPAIPKFPLRGFEYFAGGHPYPNEQSWRAAEAALSLLDQRNVTEDDLVIFLISGGGSTLMERPLKPFGGGTVGLAKIEPSISLQELRRFHEILVTCGANIQEINTVRKHFSVVKGGRLAQAAWPARQITLYVSDVPEHLPSMVASGPSMPDDSTLEECDQIMVRYGILWRFPSIFRTVFETGALKDTPKLGDPCFGRSLYYCLLANSNAVEKLAELAEAAGVVVETDTRCDDWNFQKAADYLLDALGGLRQGNPGKPVAIISGGELSCPVTGDGMGGRNQAFVLDCVTKIAGLPVVVLSAGTDGIDGNSPAAGAIADGQSLE